MSALNVVLTSESVIQADGIAFAYRSGTVRVTADDIDTHDNVSGNWKLRQAGHSEMEVNLTLQAASDVNPHINPPNFYPRRAAGNVIIKVYPWGLTGTFYQAEIVPLSSEWSGQDVHQPSTFSLSGKSTGTVYLPSDL